MLEAASRTDQAASLRPSTRSSTTTTRSSSSRPSTRALRFASLSLSLDLTLSTVATQGHARLAQPLPGQPDRFVFSSAALVSATSDQDLTGCPRRAACRQRGPRPGQAGARARQLLVSLPGQALPQAALHHVRLGVSRPYSRVKPTGSLVCAPHSPTGSNPTGATAPESRRQAVLALARKHNLVILEDDAYHFLSFDPTHLVPSYFELEAREGGKTGRVVRFDSFSKILSSGAFWPLRTCT